jgi:acyl carrier protein
MSALENELKQLIISELKLTDVSPDQIEVDAPLFGTGLGLDSIDALELAMAVHRTYGVELDPDKPEEHAALDSVRSLARFISAHRAHGIAS